MATARIYPTRTVSGNQPVVQRKPEESGQLITSLLDGVPVQIAAGDGGIKLWDGSTIPGIAGISGEGGHNLTTTGVAQQITFGSVPFEPLAVNMARPGANDGKILFYPGAADTVFSAQVGPAQTTAATDLGKQYSMTADTDGHWFVDKTKTGGSAVCEIVGIDTTVDTVRGVWFVFLSSAVTLLA